MPEVIEPPKTGNADSKPARKLDKLGRPASPGMPRLDQSNPAIKQVALNAYEKTGTLVGTAALIGCDTRTVKSILERNSDAFAECTKKLAGRALVIAEMGMDRLEQTISTAGVVPAVIATGTMIDKHLALTGKAPALINVNIASFTNTQRQIEQAQAEVAQLEADVLEATRQAHAGDTRYNAVKDAQDKS